jgi:AcrR family transcriptional regulator
MASAGIRRQQGARRTDQARTRLARRAVVAAARSLFLERGYAATTIDAVSDRSDVPPATVYRLFPGKLGILTAVLDVLIAGDDEGIPLQDRPHVAALFAEPDPRKALAGFARVTVAINTRGSDVYRILVSAAASDSETAALLAEYHRRRDEGQAQIARSLARSGALRPGLTEADAADIIHALMSPDLYRLLVTERGWTAGRYERWLAETLAAQLL